MNTRFLSRSKGSALLITLAIIVVIAIIVVGLTNSARLDRAAASSGLDRMRASLSVDSGIEKVVARLRKYTADSDLYWISQPGRLVVSKSGAGKTLAEEVSLSTGVPASSGSGVLAPAILNSPSYTSGGQGRWLIDGSANTAPDAMRLRWVYVREDGTEDVSENPDLTNTANPIVARHAYWTDDESTKLNLNTAWRREQTPAAKKTPDNHPSHVSISTLASADSPTDLGDTVHNWIEAGVPFNSVGDARQVGGDLPAIIEANKLQLTSYGSAPNRTFDGKERIYLTMDSRNVPDPKGVNATGGPNYLDLFRDDIGEAVRDPGYKMHLALGQNRDTGVASGSVLPDKFNRLISALLPQFKRKDWPVAPGKSLAEKFFGAAVTDDQAAQLAANVIDYVRIRESRQKLVWPIYFTGGVGNYGVVNHTAAGASPSGPLILAGRAPLITEMSVVMDDVSLKKADLGASGWPKDSSGTDFPELFRCTIFVELYLPPYEGLDSSFVIDFGAQGQAAYPETLPGNDVLPAARTSTSNTRYNLADNGKWYLGVPGEMTNSTTNDNLRYFFRSAQTGALAESSVNASARGVVEINAADIRSGDTRLRPGGRILIAKEFYRKQKSSARPSFVLQTYLTFSVPNDNGRDGLHDSPLSIWPLLALAPVAGRYTFPIQISTSATAAGVQSIQIDDPRAGGNVADWKMGISQFGLSPKRASTVGQSALSGRQQDTDASGRISDYSFKLPAPPASGQKSNTVASVGELGWIHTGQSALVSATPWRSLRLQPSNAPDQLPDWVLLDSFAAPRPEETFSAARVSPHARSWGGVANLNVGVQPASLLTQPRQVLLKALLHDARKSSSQKLSTVEGTELAANISGNTIADKGTDYGFANVLDLPGEIVERKGVADRGEESEETARDILALSEARSDVFTIYAIGQALKQTPANKLVVTAEQRRQSVVERSENTDGSVKFKTVYSRDFQP